MKRTVDDTHFPDELLIAYLNGDAPSEQAAAISEALETDDMLAERLQSLDTLGDAVRPAFAIGRLATPLMPAHVLTKQHVAKRLLVPAALAASFALGAFLMDAVRPNDADWIEAVASYQALYVTQTLDGSQPDAAATTRALAQAGETLGLTLEPARDVDGLSFKRAQMLGFEGQPLLQMAYLDDAGQPFAFCVMHTGQNDTAPFTTITHNLAATSWVRDGVGFILIGGDEMAVVERMAKGLIEQL